MLRKLFKYEIKATARILLPLYLVLLAFAFINRLLISPDEMTTPATISMILYILILVGTMVMTFIVMIQRFYKNLLSDEGYLMFTLPTKPWNHIVTKLLVSIIWTVVSGLVALTSVWIIAMDQFPLSQVIESLTEIWTAAYEAFGSSFLLSVCQLILAFIVILSSVILMIYAAIAMGHLANKHKLMTSIGSYILLSAISEIVIVMVGESYYSNVMINYNTMLFVAPEEFRLVHSFMWLVIILFGVLSLGYYTITNIILSKRLNLE